MAEGDWPDELKKRALRIKHALDNGIIEYVRRTFGKVDRGEINLTVFALIDVPYAAVIRHIRQSKKPPREVDNYIEQTYSAIMGREK